MPQIDIRKELDADLEGRRNGGGEGGAESELEPRLETLRRSTPICVPPRPRDTTHATCATLYTLYATLRYAPPHTSWEITPSTRWGRPSMISSTPIFTT